MGDQDKAQGPTIRVRTGKPVDWRTREIRIDSELLATKEKEARRAEILNCQQEHLAAGTAGTCTVFDCPYDVGECPEVAADWLLAHRGDEHLMRELADDPTLGRDPRKITALVNSDRNWFRVARAIPALRDVAFSRLRGFEIVVNRNEVVRLAIETGSPAAYDGLLRMLRVSGVELSADVRADLKEHLIACGADLKLWEGLLDDEEPDAYDLAPAMLVAHERAHQAASLHYVDWDQVEYWLLGILWVVDDGVPPFDRYLFDDQMRHDFDQDVKGVRALLVERGLDLGSFQKELRETLRHMPGTGRSKRRECWKAAEERAHRRGASGVWAHDVMDLCLRFPTTPVQQAIAGYQTKYG